MNAYFKGLFKVPPGHYIIFQGLLAFRREGMLSFIIMDLLDAQNERKASLTARRHYYQFYKGQEDLFRTVIPFLWLGLQNGEACLWIVSESVGIEEAIIHFHREHDLDPYLTNRQLLILPAERWYLERGRFSTDRVLTKFQRFVAERERLGFAKCRFVGDAGWFESRDWPKLRAFETKAHQVLKRLPVAALCAYPVVRCTLVQTKDIVESHDSIFATKL